MDFGGLMLALCAAPAVGIWIILAARWMMDGDLHIGWGIASIAIVILLMPAIIWPPSPIIPGLILAIIIATTVFFPFALSQANARMHRFLDTEELAKAHEAYGKHPDNVAAQFQIASSLYRYGLSEHAIGIAEKARASLSTEADPVSNRSPQELFSSEIRALAQWKADAPRKPEARIKCSRCGFANAPGNIACVRCRAPYLLDAARNTFDREGFRTRLVAGWFTLVAAIVAGAAMGANFSGGALAGGLITLICIAGIVCAAIFRPPKFEQQERA